MSTMDRAACHVIYVNRNASEDGLIHSTSGDSTSDWAADEARHVVQPLLDAFGDVHVCASGGACLTKLFELQEGSMLDLKPTLVLLDTPNDDPVPEARRRASSPSPSCSSSNENVDIHTPDEALYGLGLLQKIITEAHLRGHPTTNGQMTDGTAEQKPLPLGSLDTNRQLIRRCLDLGAVDVIICPMSTKCITSLEICAYRAHRDAAKEQSTLLEIRQGRKRSWVGVNEEKPFAYLREAMVSGLMKGICRLGTSDDQINNAHVAVSSERQSAIAEAIGSWRFCAHSFTDDELLVAAMDMFRHALAMPELERWRIHADQLISFLVACRAAYNSFVPYHNFRHVVDVLQATFNFLVHIGALSPYPSGTESRSTPEKSPMASLITPFEALTLLITAIGHDVGHPGVNNGFLVTLNAPLAQLYNDRSVLESFHCAAYSQILRRYWPSAFEDTKMRNLMISSILATDMGLHFDYMKKLGDVQERLQANNSADGWNGRQIEENKSLACSLLIKCADISNVARNHEIALKWTYILSEEFSRQASMESELSIPSSLMTPPKQDMTSLAKGQLGFMNLFATPLFQGVADIMPAMQYTVDELEMNKSLFELKLQQEKEKQPLDDPIRRRLLKEGTFSPRTMSFAVPQEEEKEEKRDMTTLFEALDRGSDTTPVGNGELPMPRPERDDLSPADSQRTMGPSAANGVVGDHRGSNGSASTFDAVRELANSDPFQTQTRRDSAKQRSSETTDGSVSGACSGDWASQATSATTGKMPMSPSTRGTSIVSGDSTEHAVGIPKINVDSASLKDSSGTLRQDGSPIDDETRSDASTTGGSIGRAEGKSLRKKTSRFRIKDLPFFRRHKGTNSPSTADMTG
ncbi:3',5'-cyclic-nucleotide phosphodiesterase regA [Fusarium odoratissimum]|uniref:Phosphodiesterase n=1 Tax=Fusarium oxysporum f. sp. cubense (strain race 4) TaxID=2502994 RepID=N1RMZ2_FUSC4|nr:3',5'-cyclic-nucleotide phosphodiesterase regA [Fusarium odoratissimum]